MSASVATPMAGLLNYDFGPDNNMPDFTASDFPHHMEIDRHSVSGQHHNHHDENSPEDLRRSISYVSNNVPTSEEQKTALGNLLGALMPTQNEQSGDVDANLENGYQVNLTAQQEPAPMNGHLGDESLAPFDHSRLPSFDATAANDLFSTEDFSQISQNMLMSQTLDEENMIDMQNGDMGHFRKDSYVSQGSITKRPLTPQQREFEAFARLQFEDGSYYLNTYACELGRDVLAYRAALEKEREEHEARLNGSGKSRSSSGRASHPSARMRRPIGSQIQGSVVSEQGGFAGIDESPMRPPKNPEKPTMSSHESESSVVKPAEYLINPRTMPSFDYHRSTELQAKWVAQEENNGEAPDDEQPAAVTSAHLPNPHMCPLIPIHGKPKDGQTDAELHKKISRRHVKIYWSFERDCWEMKVQGRNGAFCNEKFVRWKHIVPLDDGAVIQIAHVVLTFRLPKTAQSQPEPLSSPVDVDADEALPSVESRPSESVADDERRESFTGPKPTPKISLKFTPKADALQGELPVGPDGLPIVKRRGPGRPPKDGIMSTRERKEREKAAKLAVMRQANGGKTPPPAMRGKLPKFSPPVIEEVKPDLKPEKRKYTKRRSTDDDGNPGGDEDGQDEEGDGGDDGEPKSKKARAQREKSESPAYPPRESLTADQLARPSESYAVLLHKMLIELYPRALPLKDIYRELKMRYPWYVHEATTEGWQSSVRHNLNSEFGKLFDKGDKEGKGFAWRAIPNAQPPQTEKKRTTQAPVQRPRPQPPQQQRPQQIPGQGVQWQNNAVFLAQNGPQSFVNQGSWPPSGIPAAGIHPVTGSTSGTGQQRPPSNTPQPGAGLITGQAQSGQASGSSAPPPANNPAQPAAMSLGVAASNMPCTLDGIQAIKRFEQEMYRQLMVDEGPQDKRDFWHAIFASAKKRVLHGYPNSIRPEGESKAEATIMLHMKSFVEKFANPNFKGFTQRVVQPASADGVASQAQSTTPGPANGSGTSPAAPSTIPSTVQGSTIASHNEKTAMATASSIAMPVADKHSEPAEITGSVQTQPTTGETLPVVTQIPAMQKE